MLLQTESSWGECLTESSRIPDSVMQTESGFHTRNPRKSITSSSGFFPVTPLCKREVPGNHHWLKDQFPPKLVSLIDVGVDIIGEAIASPFDHIGEVTRQLLSPVVDLVSWWSRYVIGLTTRYESGSSTLLTIRKSSLSKLPFRETDFSPIENSKV